MELKLNNFADEMARRGIDIYLANGGQNLRLVGDGINSLSPDHWAWMRRNREHLIASLLRTSGNGQRVE